MAVAFWLKASWGKFRSWERTQDPRLSRAQLTGARRFWEVLVETGNPGLVMEAMKSELASMPEETRGGVSLFGTWLLESQGRLAKERSFAEIADPTHAKDTVQVELL